MNPRFQVLSRPCSPAPSVDPPLVLHPLTPAAEQDRYQHQHSNICYVCKLPEDVLVDLDLRPRGPQTRACVVCVESFRAEEEEEQGRG